MNRLSSRRLAGAIPCRQPTLQQVQHARALSNTRFNRGEGSKNTALDVQTLLLNPTWSVSSLLPPKDSTNTNQISSKQLHHLLRLSALPPPKDAAEEEKMLSTLSSQLHFVKDIQKVEASGVEPLRSLRDETTDGEQAAELDKEALREALELEEVRGKHHKRIRRKNGGQGEKEEEWDVLGAAERKVGRYFVVEGGKGG